MTKNNPKKVFIGMSGGVDSSVSALLLKEAGFDVTGVFIKVWHPDFIPCNWRAEMQDAMRICAKLEIPFLTCDSEKEYKEGVIDYMISEYEKGNTPNPDVMCNKYVKFDSFLKFALEKGADFIATGHYAQNIEKDNHFYFSESKDKEKDQTYFLWNINQEILSHTLFPIGHLEKKEVRYIAEKNNLITADKKDSQGLCFIGNINMKEFLKNYIETVPGDVLDEQNEVIGKHEGSILYTIGERHGFEIFEKTDSDLPYFVISKNKENNSITVSNNKKDFSKKKVILIDVNFIREANILNTEITARTRYRQKLENCKIINQDNKNLTVLFNNSQKDITSGQSVVFYKDRECLGGGVIS